MKNNRIALLDEVEKYYTSKINQYGETPQGVDWNGEKGQTLRFEQLCKIVATKNQFSINDLGSGYGALFEFLNSHYSQFSYLGIDVSESMVQAGVRRHKEKNNARFLVGSKPDQTADYSVASGIFNVRLEHSDSDWQNYYENTIDVLDQTSRLGFAFNFLTSYSDPDKMHKYLYYANPCTIFDFCKRRYSSHVALMHDYGLYEFTILVRKSL